MKQKTISALTVMIFLLSCSNKDNSIISEIQTENGKISRIDFNLIPAEIKELKLSDLINDFRFIPLETKKECLISNTMIEFSSDFIFVGTQNFPGAARLYRFDKNGKFINEIGKSGQGPGEHIGYLADVIHSYEDNNTVLVSWGGGQGEKPQLFNIDGTLIEEINLPFRLRYINKWSDSIWFSPGAFAGNAKMISDSIALVFYNSNGKILKKIPRRLYPPKNLSEYTPTPWAPSIYKYNDHWRLFMEGNDTIFKIVDMNLIPISVLASTKDILPYNKPVSADELPGKYHIRILAENNNNLYIDKSVIKKVDLKQFSPGQWGGSFTNDDQLIIIDKKSNKASNLKITDDIFHLFPDELFSQLLKWQDDRLFFSVPPIFITKLLKELDIETLDNKSAIETIEKLKIIPSDDNPVIFTFSLKDRVRILD